MASDGSVRPAGGEGEAQEDGQESDKHGAGARDGPDTPELRRRHPRRPGPVAGATAPDVDARSPLLKSGEASVDADPSTAPLGCDDARQEPVS